MKNKQSFKEVEQTVKALGYDKGKLQAFIEIFDNILGSVRGPLVVLDSDFGSSLFNKFLKMSFIIFTLGHILDG